MSANPSKSSPLSVWVLVRMARFQSIQSAGWRSTRTAPQAGSSTRVRPTSSARSPAQARSPNSPSASLCASRHRDAAVSNGLGRKSDDALNTARLSAEELHRRHIPMLDELEPLIERGQKQSVFRSDLPVAWHLAVIRAIVHTASRESQGGRIPESEAEAAMLKTALNAIAAPRV